MKNVLNFTKRVLPLSNTFVASQSRYFERFKPVFSGFNIDPRGKSLVENYQSCVLADYTRFPKYSKFLHEAFGRLNPKWLAALEGYQPELVHAHFGKGGFYAAPISKSLSKPLLVTFHGSDITQKDRFSYNQTHRKTVFEEASRILASSKFIASKLIANGCPENKLSTHYIGVDIKQFAPSKSKSIEPTILFVGRLIRQKGCEYLLNAMKTINQNIPEAKLLVVGNGVEKAKLETIAKDLKNIEFLGAKSHDEVRMLMDSAWVMCAPSIKLERGNEEGLGMVFLEAQAMATPVVSFETGGVVEAVKNNETGLLVVEKDTNALADALIYFLNNRTVRDEFGQRGVERVASTFNLETQSKKLELLYESIL